MRDLGAIELRSAGRVVATLAEMQTYLWGVPEDRDPPALVSSFVAGRDVDPAELYAALIGEGRRALDGDAAALAVLDAVTERLHEAFPETLR